MYFNRRFAINNFVIESGSKADFLIIITISIIRSKYEVMRGIYCPPLHSTAPAIVYFYQGIEVINIWVYLHNNACTKWRIKCVKYANIVYNVSLYVGFIIFFSFVKKIITRIFDFNGSFKLVFHRSYYDNNIL